MFTRLNTFSKSKFKDKSLFKQKSFDRSMNSSVIDSFYSDVLHSANQISDQDSAQNFLFTFRYRVFTDEEQATSV